MLTIANWAPVFLRMPILNCWYLYRVLWNAQFSWAFMECVLWSTWHVREPLRSEDKPTYTEHLISCEDITTYSVVVTFCLFVLHNLSIWFCLEICNKSLDQLILRPPPPKPWVPSHLDIIQGHYYEHRIYFQLHSLWFESWCLLDVWHWEMCKTTLSLSVHIFEMGYQQCLPQMVKD